MDKHNAIALSRKYLNLVKPVIHYKKVYLFGSYINDMQRNDSDIDICILVERFDGDPLIILKKLYKIRRSVDVRIEPHLFVAGKDITGFFEEIERTGILI